MKQNVKHNLKTSKNPRGRPKTRDILNLSQSIPAESPEALAKLLFSTPPEKVK
ncbi:MAG: hypothetical protein OXC92_10125 [Flavobacteriaceae bacterium]|nr:hypothetical protein [Flavobacteriaceae bacterium]MCY4217327.1 hypothetical protein [Flavobacteriaceae bacterium]